MKCDELKPLVFSIKDFAYIDEPAPQKNYENPHDHAVYKATEVDAAIAELKAKLEDAKATAYAESVDAGMRERRLKRALWLSRAELCHMLDVDRYLRNHRHSWYNENCLTWDDACAAMEVKICKAESKCRAKAEE